MDKSTFARRAFLMAGLSSLAFASRKTAFAAGYSGSLPFRHDSSLMPAPVSPGGWQFFSAKEAGAIGALVDRLIPSDELSAGGKAAGIDVYIDRQLAGGFGQDAGMYLSPPYADAALNFGPQSALTSSQRYRKSLEDLDDLCKSAYLGKGFADLPGPEQDKLLKQMEAGTLQFKTVNAKAFFTLLWQNAKEGFFADPIYGGNKDMAGWRLLGFPGARYDYRNWIDKHNQPYPLPPIGIDSHPDWSRPA